jgi:hypothetical protein
MVCSFLLLSLFLSPFSSVDHEVGNVVLYTFDEYIPDLMNPKKKLGLTGVSTSAVPVPLQSHAQRRHETSRLTKAQIYQNKKYW